MIVTHDHMKEYLGNLEEYSAYAELNAKFGYGSERDGQEFNFDFC